MSKPKENFEFVVQFSESAARRQAGSQSVTLSTHPPPPLCQRSTAHGYTPSVKPA